MIHRSLKKQSTGKKLLDPVKIAPESYSLLMENEYVRLLKFRQGGGYKAEMHTHPPHVAYVLKGGKMRFFTALGTYDDFVFQEGEIMLWDSMLMHSAENLGAEEIEALIIENRKKEPTPLTEPDPVKVSPENYKIIGENLMFRILELRINPGAEDEFHAHPELISYTLSDSAGRLHTPDGRIEELQFRKGDILFSRHVEKHRIENTGPSEIHQILFELKNQKQARSILGLNWVRGPLRLNWLN